MFYEVRIFSPQGDLKRVVSTRELSEAHWDAFEKSRVSEPDSLNLLQEYKSKLSTTRYQAKSGHPVGKHPGVTTRRIRSN